MSTAKFLKLRVISMVAVCLLTACGESLNSGLSGVVAVGAPVPYAKVTLTDANGTVLEVTSDANGGYTFDTLGKSLNPPFIINASGAIGQQEVALNSVVTTASTLLGATTANVTPLTTAMTALMAGPGIGYNPEAISASNISQASYNAAKNSLLTAIAPALTGAGLKASSFDPVSTPFVTNRQGADQVLDVVDVRLRPHGVSLSNRFQPLDVAGGSSSLTDVVLTAAGPTGSVSTLQTGVNPASQAMNEFERLFKLCFSDAAATRVGGTLDGYKDAGGFVVVPEVKLSSACKAFVYRTSGGAIEYQTNSYSYGEWWGSYLANPDFDGGRVIVKLLYVVNNAQIVPSDSDDGNAYVVNINISDKFGNWYTRPDLLIRKTVNGTTSFLMSGNRRPLDFSVQPGYTMIDDLSSTKSRVEARLQFFVAPHRSVSGSPATQEVVTAGKVTTRQKWNLGSSTFTYDSTDLDQNNLCPNGNGCQKPAPRLICAWVTGPFLQGNFDQDDSTAPKGGVLLKLPSKDAVNIRNYMAVAAKYSFDFDPINNLDHRTILYIDCKDVAYTGGYIGTSGTVNSYTLHGAKATASGDWVFTDLPSNNGVQITSANLATCGIGNCPRRSFLNSRPIAVTEAEMTDYRNRYGNADMARYTAYFFKSDNFPSSTQKANPWTDVSNFWENRVTFPGPVRMVGAMPFVPTLSDGVTYDDSIKFRKLKSSTLQTYLAATTTTIAANGKVTLDWDVPKGAQGVDRIGGLSRAYYTGASAGTYSWIVPSIAQISGAVSRNVNTGDLVLGQVWQGTNSTPSIYSNPSAWTLPAGKTVDAAYRELWTRSYDSENRQIQYVANRMYYKP